MNKLCDNLLCPKTDEQRAEVLAEMTKDLEDARDAVEEWVTALHAAREELKKVTEERDEALRLPQLSIPACAKDMEEASKLLTAARQEAKAWRDIVKHIPLHNYPDAMALVLQALAQFPEKGTEG